MTVNNARTVGYDRLWS